MTTEAKILAHSRGPSGQEVVTFQLRYWLAVHAELMTHRMFSRNASSSRAIPVKKMIDDVLTDPAMPVFWGKNQSGMQAREELTGDALDRVQTQWLKGRDAAVFHVQNMLLDDLHKQLANRLLAPWLHISVVLTSTVEGLANFWHLRDHPDAQPEIQVLAREMRRAFDASQPRQLEIGEWHLPYIRAVDWEAASAQFGHDLVLDVLRKVSAARCCRVSYNKHDGAPASIEEDLALCDRLVGSRPLHSSPFEHQAEPDSRWFYAEIDEYVWDHPELHGNLPGWIQYRKTLAGEFLTELPAVRECGE